MYFPSALGRLPISKHILFLFALCGATVADLAVFAAAAAIAAVADDDFDVAATANAHAH